jgi:arylsulfatase A-like enzyme
MKSLQEEETKSISFLQLFRFNFVIFSLYLLRNILHRWDGFRFYAPFTEYIPAVAVVTILWTFAAVLTTIVAWILCRFIEDLSDRVGMRIGIEHILLFGAASVLLGVAVWKIKRLLWSDVQTSEQLKQMVFAGVILTSAFTTWLFRDKAGSWFAFVNGRITPLVWLFGIGVVLSVPTAAVYTFWQDAAKPVPDQFPRSSAVESHKKSPNILLVTFDTLTAKDMSLYGYDRETTPFISAWAGDATVFTRAEAENNHTTPAAASLMTGKRVWTHQVYHPSGSVQLKSTIESLPRVLKDNGYYNLAFVVNPSASTKTLGIFDSFDISPLMTEFYRDERFLFDIYHGDIPVFLYNIFGDKVRLHNWILDRSFLGGVEPFILPKYELMNPERSRTVVPPEIAFNRFLDIYDDLPEPFFAWILVLPPHSLYLPPEPYRGMFGPSFPPDRYRAFVSDIDSRTMYDMRILYDEFIRYCDKQFEDFITSLEEREKSGNTTIILSSDHGESFQHNVFQHAVPALYEQLTHIPLVIKEPGQLAARIIHDIVEQVDIPATILDLAGIPVPAWMEGRSLVPLMRGEKLSPRPVFSMYYQTNPSRGHEITKGLIATWEGDYKLIHNLEDGKSLLFNLRNDPEEMNNLIESETEVGQHLLDLIKMNLKEANERIRLNNQAS